MLTTITNHRFVLFLAFIIGLTTACKKDDGDAPTPSTPGYRTTKIDYSTLTPTTSYRTAFLDENGDSTVNRNDGRARLRMFRALAAYISSAASTNTAIDSARMSNMFANKNNAFDGIYADLNTADLSIKEGTAFSKANQEDVHHFFEVAFGRMAYISQFTGQTASDGTPGKLGTYLVDENGIEWEQVIFKGLIGAYHLDYISNVLLNTGLDADNQHLVTGKKYTQLEHNWDEAYGFLTFNDMFYNGTTDENVAKNFATEYYLGSYVWQYNIKGLVKLHSAFLKGRAAIHNNDMATVREQAALIREVLETTIGAAGKGYMVKSADAASTEPARARAFGEGYGIVYSTRFCSLNGGNNAYSEDLLDDLFVTPTTSFYDITAAQYTTVRNKLIATFNLQ